MAGVGELTNKTLPEGWAECVIADIAAVNPKTQAEESVVAGFVPMSHAPTDFNGELKFDEKPWGEIKKSYTNFKDGDVIFAKVTPCFENGKAALVEGLPNGVGAGSSEFYVLRAFSSEVLPETLFGLIKGHRFMKEGAENMTGAVGLRRVPRAFVQSFPVALPPLAEQKAIAEKLDTLLAQVENTKARLERIPKILKRFRQSVLAAAVSGKLTEEWRCSQSSRTNLIDDLEENQKTRRGLPEVVRPNESIEHFLYPGGWGVYSVASLLRKGVIKDLKDGNHGANHPKAAEFSLDGLPFITAAQMDDSGNIDYANAPKVSGEALERLRVGFSFSGDVIYSHKGTVGRVSINDRDCVLSPQTTYIRLNPEFIANKYYALMLRSNAFTNQVDEVKSQTTRDFVPITAHYSLYSVVPPLEEQTEIVRRVDQLFAYADTIETQINNALKRVNNLTQSILAKAFRGELTEQWRKDNPDLITGENSAEALLEKIKAERAAAKPVKRGRRKAK